MCATLRKNLDSLFVKLMYPKTEDRVDAPVPNKEVRQMPIQEIDALGHP